MSIPVRLQPGTFESDCWPTPQEYNAEIFRLARAFLDVEFAGLYVSASEPPVDQRDKTWHIPGGHFYDWINGAWQREYEIPANSELRWMFKGLSVDVPAFINGAGNPALWEIDTDFADKIPMGIGTTVTEVALTAGAANHTLTEAEGASGVHTHAFGKSNNAAGSSGDDAFFSQTGMRTVQSYSGTYITGSNGVITSALTQADLFTLPSGTDGLGVAPASFSIIPPVRGVYWLKRTAQVYCLAPY